MVQKPRLFQKNTFLFDLLLDKAGAKQYNNIEFCNLEGGENIDNC